MSWLNILTATGLESSFGSDKKAFNLTSNYIGPLQVGEDTAKAYPDIIKSREDLLDLEKSAKIYSAEVKKRTKDNKSWKKWSINKRSEDLRIPGALVEWITWNQGRGGAIDIITTASHGEGVYESGSGAKTSGNLSEDVKKNILSNLSSQAKLKAEKVSSDKELAEIYIQHVKEKWIEKHKTATERFGWIQPR